MQWLPYESMGLRDCLANIEVASSQRSATMTFPSKNYSKGITNMSFEFDGEKYKQASRHQKTMGRGLISELKLTGDETILDIGCGDGVLTEELSRLVPNGQVVGIDASLGMIKTARNLQHHNLTFAHMDINNIAFREEFDLVFSNATLHWIKNHKRLLQNIYKSLKPNGMARYNFAGDGNCANLLYVLKEVMASDRFVAYFDNFDWPWYMPKLSDYRKLVNLSEFRERRIWGETTDSYFDSVAEMIGWIDQPCLVPFLKCIDNEEHKKQFRNIVIQQMIKRTKQDDDRCFETGRRINVLARKHRRARQGLDCES